ncbi:sugar phosphate isomerase/epimerase [Candidatus Gottesmanbacteria bacterium]|nr:sugar phosphate isomerase/epimerase [Candidatus Gottesmanbacteria bacterium]
MGVNHIEIFLEYLPNTKELQFLKQKLSSYQKLIHAPIVNLSLISQWEEVRKVYFKIMDKVLRLSQELEAKVVTCHVGPRPFFIKPTEAQKIVLKEFPPLFKKGVNLAFENMPPSTGVRLGYPLLSELESLGEKDPRVFFCLDVGHAIRNEEEWEKFLRKQTSRIVNIHLHDAKGDDDHLKLGSGTLNLDKFLKVLEEIHYSGYLTLEVLGENKDIAASWKILTAAR